MEVTKIVPGCFHLQKEAQSALFGSPPEILKFIIREGKDVPAVGVLPDIAYFNGVSQIALEFPAYWLMFHVQGGHVKQRFRIIGTPEMCERVREILAITMIGPTRAQMKRWKISKTRIAMLTKIMDHLALKSDGKNLAIDDVFEFVNFSKNKRTGVQLFRDDDLLVWRKGNNCFEVGIGAERQKIDLSFTGEQLPPLSKPDTDLELPQVLRVKLLGSYSGFDTTGPTTGMVLWVNCNGFLVDGPVGTSAYLRRLGIPKSDLCGVILSHVHDDHCTLMDMILSEQTVNIISTREIYESMLIKVAAVLGDSPDQIRNYLTFTEVIPGKKTNMFGATWEFFYTVHSIPTIGFRVTVRGVDGDEHSVVHSSDTIHYSGLEEMRQVGAITEAHEKRMKEMVRGGEDLVIVDGGGLPIHGIPADFDEKIKENPQTDFLFCHVNPEQVTEKRWPVATPGWSKTIIYGKNLPQSLILKLLKTLKLLEISDPKWINILFSQGAVVEIDEGVDVVSKGQSGDNFYFVLAGSQEVLDTNVDPPRQLAVLEGGDFFGEMSIIKDVKRNATVRTLSSTVLFRLPGELFIEFVEASGLKEKFERIWLSRSFISEVQIFRNLHPHAKHELSLLSDEQEFVQDEVVIRQGGKTDGFYIITKGRAKVVVRDSKGNEEIRGHLRRGEFFGENVAMGYRNRRNASIVAETKTLRILKFSGSDIRRLAASVPVLRHELHIVMKERGLKSIPVTPRESGEIKF